MNIFQSVLSQIKEKIGLEEDKIKSITTVIKDITNITISPSDIQIKKGALILRTQPTMKMAILLKKEKIILELKKNNITVNTIR